MISIVVLAYNNNISTCEAIWIEVGSTGVTKCVSEDIKQNVVVIADFSLVNLEDVSSQLLPVLSIKVFLLSLLSCQFSLFLITNSTLFSIASSFVNVLAFLTY